MKINFKVVIIKNSFLLLFFLSSCNNRVLIPPEIPELEVTLQEDQIQTQETILQNLELMYPTIQTQQDINSAYPITQTSNIQIEIEDITDIPIANKPISGKASFSGIIYSYVMHQLIPNTAFYITPAIGKDKSFPPIIAGPNVEQGDIYGFTDNNGGIVLNNIEPGNYYLIVWSPYNWTFAVIDMEEEKPMLFKLDEDKLLNSGVILVQWP